MDHGPGTSDRLTPLSPARVVWRGDQPVSIDYADIYHAADGPAEVQRVFIAPNRLAERFGEPGAPVFRIGELGFGTGLNFVTASERFLQHARSDRRLHFVSFEAHPLVATELSETSRRRQRDHALYDELARAYPPLVRGWHRRHLAAGRIVLSLFFGDALEGISDLSSRRCAPIDAWFLDGFAPDRNPALWSDAILSHVALLSGEATTLATFSVAGRVRRGLEAVGFAVERVAQLPFKRHTLRGEFRGAARPRPSVPALVTVVGAGLAGSATARALARWGIATRLVDRRIPARNSLRGAVMHPRLMTRGLEWRARSFAYAAHVLRSVPGVATSGALQFATDGYPTERLERAADVVRDADLGVTLVDESTASGIAGMPVAAPALHFRDGATVDLDAACNALIAGIEIEYAESSPTGDGPIVVCTGIAATEVRRYLRLISIEGQVDVLRIDGGPLVPIVGEGFVAPLGAGAYAAGATYEHRAWDIPRATAFNRERVERFLARIGSRARVKSLSGIMRGVRAVTPDRLPVISRAPDTEDADAWLNLGHGSAGTITAPLGAECIAA
jgi:tRNA 5-methylaminomethyl-2-thiouridine biosynthesis bifunctional protein